MSDVSEKSRRPRQVTALAVIVGAEAASMAGVTLFLVVELFVARPQSVATAIALAVFTALAAIWLSVVVVGVVRGRAWVRGAIVTWQILQIAVAGGAFQGVFARQDIGWLLLAPSLAALVLLFLPPVSRYLSHRG